ncbi:MAG: gamma-glutamyltransferase [Magnetovibrio sp.]|nr:gamma-glutamyltransferase [Magnetovibrio sp.]
MPKGEVGFVQGFLGGVAADEPQAVLVGRDVLAAGGSAADAAVAVYFMLAVTMPASAGLAGGGICLVRGPKANIVETIDFLGQRSTGANGAQVNVPGNPRGIFALHAKYGDLRWGELIRPAEQAARFGVQVSRAMAQEISRGAPIYGGSPEARDVFIGRDGRPVSEGAVFEQQALSGLISRIRAHGPGDLYSGTFAQEFVAAAKAAGAALTYEDLRSFTPEWRGAVDIPFSTGISYFFPMPRSPAGTMAAKEAAILAIDRKFIKADEGERVHLLAEAIQRAIVDGGRGFQKIKAEGDDKNGARIQLPEDYVERLLDSYHADRVVQLSANGIPSRIPEDAGGGTSFVVADRVGGAVSCSLTMNGRFGSGRMPRGTGVFLANPPSSVVERDLSLGNVMLVNRFRKKLYMVGASSGGAAAQAALVQTAFRASGNTPDNLEQAIARKRIFRDPVTAVTYMEDGLAPASLNALRKRGHRLQSIPTMGRVNIAFCETGIPHKKPEDISCEIKTDPRGAGHATSPG